MKTKTAFPQPWRLQVLTVSLCLAAAALFLWTVRIQFSREAADLRQMGDDLYQGVWLEVDPPAVQYWIVPGIYLQEIISFTRSGLSWLMLNP